jgi:drug/metabolite transporter (DMT)-like permease
MFLFGTLVFFPLYLVEMESIPYFHITAHGILGISYGSICSSLIGYYLYNYAAKYLKANEIGIFSYSEPIITAIIAIPLLGEQITFIYLLGSLFVFIGIIIAENRLHFHPGHNLKPH